MVINCPIKNSNEVVPLAICGAGTFYGGLSAELIFRAGDSNANRRPWRFANFNSINDFKEALSLIHKHHKTFYLTLNAHSYSKSQNEQIVEFLSVGYDIDGIIVSDINLILLLQKRFDFIPLVASTGLNIQNKKSVEFYRELGISEIILPRHLMVEEIRELVTIFPDMLFECFILNDDCSNIDGLCRYCHGVFDKHSMQNACRALTDFSVYAPSSNYEQMSALVNLLPKIMIRKCGACEIQQFNEYGLARIKIVGRQYPLDYKIASVKFIQAALSYIDQPPEKYFGHIQELFMNYFNKSCNNNCYYDNTR